MWTQAKRDGLFKAIMMCSQFSIESFLEEGLILQTKEKIFVSLPPFYFHDKLCPSQVNFYAPDFFFQQKKIITSPFVQTFEPEEFIVYLSQKEEKHCPPPWVSPSFQYFQEVFSAFKENKKLIKAVPVFFAQSAWRLSSNKRAFLINNILKKKTGFVYGFWNKNSGIIGATPEYLFEKKGKDVKTMALAGTGRLSEDLMTDEKEIKEHQIVVDDLSSRFCGVRFKKSFMYEKIFGDLKHLQTDVEFQSDMDFLSLVQKFHPTSALGGVPKTEAWYWLKKYNWPLDRKKFGAPFSVCFPNGDGFSLVSIRNIQWDQKSVILGSGCGLTDKSKLEKEWQELELKRQWVIHQLWK